MAGILDFLFGGPVGEQDALGNPVLPRLNQRQPQLALPVNPRDRNDQILAPELAPVPSPTQAPFAGLPVNPRDRNDQILGGNFMLDANPAAPPVATGTQLAASELPAEDRTPTVPPQPASRSGDGPIMARFNPLPDAGPTINNAGILGNTRGPIGFQPISGGSPMTHSDGGLALMGYERAPNGNLRPLGISNGNSLMQVQDLADQARMNGPSFDLGSQAGIDAMNQFREGSMARAQGQIGSFMQNQLGQDQLGLQRMQAFGANGVPGSMQLNAQAASAQNSPAGLDAIRRQQVVMELTRQGLSQPQIAEELRRLPPMSGPGSGLPNYLGSLGTQGERNLMQGDIAGYSKAGDLATGGGNTTGGNTAERPADTSRIGSVMSRAIQSFQGPAGPNGRRPQAVIPPYQGANIEPIHNAISNYFGEFSPEELRNNYPEIANAAIHNFGQMAMNGWQASRSSGTHADQRLRATNAQGLPPVRSFMDQSGRNLRDILGLPLSPFQSGDQSWDARIGRLGW